MSDPAESYYLRFWKRLLKDATPWARDNILWGCAALLIPPLLVYLRDPHAKIDWSVIESAIWFYAVTFTLYVLVHVCRIPKKLDDDREADAQVLSESIGKREEIIGKITSKPPRTPAEQHDFDTASRALERFGQKAKIALRHLRRHESLTFGVYDPILPSGLNRDDTVWAYNACAGEGLVTRRDNDPRYGEATFAIAPKMAKALDELLYENNSS
jgi:hypothetical protein